MRSLIKELSSDKNPLEIAELNLEIGWAFRQKGAVTNDILDYRKAKEYLKTAFEMCRLRDEYFMMGKAKYFLGIVEPQLSDLTRSPSMTQAIRCFKAALEYFDRCGEVRWWSLAKRKIGDAWYFNHEGDYISNLNTSICQYRDALSAAHVGQWEDDIDKIENNMCIAEIKRAIFLRPKPLTCFISYSWEDPDHKNWVINLAEELHNYEIEVRLDQWDEADMYDIPKYMETSIRESDYVLLICTPLFASKANTGVGGVGYEKYVITGEIFTNTSERSKFIPLLKSGGPEAAIPSYLKGALYYDFTGSRDFKQVLHTLLRRLYEIPRHRRPDFSSELISNDNDKFGAKKRYRIEYIADTEFPSDFFHRIPHAKDGPVSLDARCRLASFSSESSMLRLKIASIDVDENRSNWYSDPGLLQRYTFDAKEGRDDFRLGVESFEPVLEQYYTDAAWHFQQGNPDRTGQKIKDPVLDITILNTGNDPVVITGIGVCPLALWSIPKMIYQPRIIPTFDIYYLECNFEKMLCNISLTDPVYVPSKHPFRFSMSLINYAEELRRFRSNESSIAFIVNGTQDKCWASKPIYLGVTG